MSGLDMQKRLAADILGCGENKVVFKEESLKEIKEAITRDDIKSLIVKGFISAKKTTGVSRARARKHHVQKKKGRAKGLGKRKGTKNARTPKKESWMNRIRPQREFIRMLKEKEKITNAQFRKLYLLAKGGFFRSRRHLKLHVSKMTGAKI